MARVNPIQVQKYLSGMNYSASKQDVLRHAEDRDADEDVRWALRQLPDQQFETAADVSKALGKIE